MQLALVLAPGSAAVGDQFVVARVEAESVLSPPASRITSWIPAAHAAIVRRRGGGRPCSPGRRGLLDSAVL